MRDLDVRLTKAPSVFDYRRTASMRYELTLTTGAADERFNVLADPPSFGDGGSPFQIDRPILELTGPAEVTGEVGIFALPNCSPSFDVHHGAEPALQAIDVTAPAGTTSLLRVSFGVWRRDAPFLGMRVRPTITIGDRLRSSGPGATGTVGGELVIKPQAPRLVGPTGVRITLETRPRTPLFNPNRSPTLEAGRTISVYGRTSPVLRRQMISIRTLRPGRGRTLRRLARVRTDYGGRFRYRWRPRKPGVHQLFAFYRRQQRNVTSDRTCPRFVKIARRRR